jgi:predicted metalloprotease with PDZ domain
VLFLAAIAAFLRTTRLGNGHARVPVARWCSLAQCSGSINQVSLEELVFVRTTTAVALFAATLAAVPLAGCSKASMAPPNTTPAGSTAEQRSPNPFDIMYRIGWSDPSTHMYDVEINVAHVSGDVVRLQMPVWSPGRYAPFYFARNVTDFRVENGNALLAWDRENGSLWRIQTNGATAFTVRYRVFANTLSGTFSVLDSAHANWNGPSLFMYVVGHKADPARLHVAVPNGWRIVNGDSHAAAQADYSFENYDRLVDTPTELSRALLVDSLRIDNRIYRSMVHHNGPAAPALRRKFLDDLGKIVRYENTVFDPPPLEMYTFLFNIGYPGGDGMEHLYSTQIIDQDQWAEGAAVLPGISTAAHEYFHVWNMKRVRAAALGPFDYTREVYQPSLWVGEGWTQYYGMVALPRSGVTQRNDIYTVASQLINANLTAPGRKHVSARMSSFEAPFFDGSTAEFAVDPNAWFTYYYKGAGIALYLDLFIRGHTNNVRSLDDAFRLLRDRTWGAPNASYYLQGRGYTEDDVERAVSDAAGTDMHPWFERHVGGTEDMKYEEVLALAGLTLSREGGTLRVEPIAGATAAQIRIRDGWMAGKTAR